MKLPKFEDFKAPWENDLKEGDDPNEVEIDRTKLKRYIYNVLTDKEKAQDKVETLTTERDEAVTKLTEKEREGESETEKLKRERDEAVKKAEKAGEVSVETLKLRVALKKGLTETQAKRLVGSTQEELEADADELLKDFGATSKASDDEDDDDDGDEAPRVTPRSKTRNPGDPAGESPNWDPDKAADAYFATNGGVR